MIAYAIEPLEKWRPDAEPLLIEHWDELATFKDVPLEPHWPWYERAEDAGNLVIYTARYDGALIAYAPFIVLAEHPHYKSIGAATNDVVWVDPNSRRSGVGNGLRQFVEKDLASRFAKIAATGKGMVGWRSKASSPELGKMLESADYVTDELGHHKVI